MQDWALILGSSSGFGAATCRELAKHGINIYGIHLDRKAGTDRVNNLVDDLKNSGVEVHFNNMNATDASKRQVVIDELKSRGNIRVKILLHSLAFGTLRPTIDAVASSALQQSQVEMTHNVMGNSLLFWVQDLYQANHTLQKNLGYLKMQNRYLFFYNLYLTICYFNHIKIRIFFRWTSGNKIICFCINKVF